MLSLDQRLSHGNRCLCSQVVGEAAHQRLRQGGSDGVAVAVACIAHKDGLFPAEGLGEIQAGAQATDGDEVADTETGVASHGEVHGSSQIHIGLIYLVALEQPGPCVGRYRPPVVEVSVDRVEIVARRQEIVSQIHSVPAVVDERIVGQSLRTESV